MPAENSAAEIAPAQNTAANPQGNSDKVATESQLPQQSDVPQSETPAEPTRRESLFNALGIPPEVQKAVFHTEEEPTAPTPEPEAKTEDEPEPAKAEATDSPEDGETEPQGEETPHWAKQRIDKLTQQKNREREAKEAVEAKLAEAAERLAQLEAQPPVTVAPTAADPLADVNDFATLEKKLQTARWTRKWARANPEGVTVNEGTPQERTVSAEEMQQILSEAEDVIEEHAPRKAGDLQLRAENEQRARETFPDLFKRGSEDYQVAQIAYREIPGLATHPAGPIFIGYYLKGVHADLAQKAKNGNGNGHLPDGKRLDPRLTAAHQRTIPPIAPVAPRAPSSASLPPGGSKRVAEAMQQMVASGGSRDALMAAVRAQREASQRGNPQAPAVS